MTATESRIAALIADKLTNGLQHPGDVATEQLPMVIRLPMFRTVGAPPEVGQQVDLTVKLIAEAIVHLIKTDAQCDIVPRQAEGEPPQQEETP